MDNPLKACTSVQRCRFHNIRRYSLYSREIQKHRQAAAQHTRENNTELYQIRIAQPRLGLSSKELNDLICHTVIWMPDPFPYDNIDGCGNQRRQNIQGCQTLFQSRQFIQQKRLDQRDEETHTQLQQQENKCVFPGVPIKLCLKHTDVILKPYKPSRRIDRIVFK